MTKTKAHLKDRQRLPIGPFSDWIKHLVARHGTNETARLIGMTERQVWRAIHRVDSKGDRRWEVKSVSLDVVDSALTFADTDTLLQDLYPELYEEAI